MKSSRAVRGFLPITARRRHDCRISDQLEALSAELRAICFWDKEYLSRDDNDELDHAAWRARRLRVEEICAQIAATRKTGSTIATYSYFA